LSRTNFSLRFEIVSGKRQETCYTHPMRIAISIPDTLFAEAEQYARARGMARSTLYARAIQYYLDVHRHRDITAALDAIYAEDPNPIAPAVVHAQSAAVLPDGGSTRLVSDLS
jgi:hypothetical protein